MSLKGLLLLYFGDPGQRFNQVLPIIVIQINFILNCSNIFNYSLALSPPVDQSCQRMMKVSLLWFLLLSSLILEILLLWLWTAITGQVLLYFISMLTTQYYHPIIIISATCFSQRKKNGFKAKDSNKYCYLGSRICSQESNQKNWGTKVNCHFSPRFHGESSGMACFEDIKTSVRYLYNGDGKATLFYIMFPKICS